MSGRKQHFIPQVLLRGFAREARGIHRLWVHHRERGSFAANVQDVAASRDFYSSPGAAGEAPTLDDRITRHENRLASDLAFLRQAPAGRLARPDIARTVVAHLAFRTEAMRDLTGEAMVITQRLKEWMATPAVMLKFIGADGPRPGERFDAFLQHLREDPRWAGRFGSIPPRRFRKMIFETVREAPARFAGGMMEEAAAGMAVLLTERRDLAREAHSSALAEDVASSVAEKGLDGLDWSLLDYDIDLPLPDTVVLASRDGRAFDGLWWTNPEDRRHVVLPLDHGRLLQGSRDGPVRYEPGALADALARGANAFAVSRDPIKGLDPATIGQANAAALDRIVATAVEDVFTGPLRRSRRRPAPAPSRPSRPSRVGEGRDA